MGNVLTPELREQLLQHLGDRLAGGEVLVTSAQFEKAAAEGYQLLTGEAVSEAVQQEVREFLEAAHQEDPSQLTVPGLENWISLTVLGQVRQAGWGLIEVQEGGTQLIRELLHSAKAQALLTQLGVKAQMVNMSACQRTIVNKVARKRDDTQRKSAARLAQLADAATKRAARAAREQEAVDLQLAQTTASVDGDDVEAAQERLDGLLLPPVEPPTEAEIEARRASEAAERRQLRQTQMTELITHLDSYVERGRISEEDAQKLREAHKAEQARRARDPESMVRNSVLEGTVRDSIEKSMKKSVDYVVAYLQVFRALLRIDARYDASLRFLVEHGEAINADPEPEAPSPLGPVIEALAAETSLMQVLVDLMDRKEAEVRMMAAHLPPYNLVLKRDQARLERVAVDVAFVEALREMPEEQLSQRMHSADKRQRARLPAAMLSLIVLIGRVFKPTPFRKELRMLKIHLIIEEFYRATKDVEQARHQAQEFLKGRLKRLYPDLEPGESDELQRRGEEIVRRVEKKVLAERAGSTGGGESGATASSDSEDLSEDEKRMGAMLVRIPTRIAGRERNIRHVVMPEEGEGERFVVARRDPESGELVPALRRGKPRFAERGRDGVWELVKD
jgi:hypothetical protein